MDMVKKNQYQFHRRCVDESGACIDAGDGLGHFLLPSELHGHVVHGEAVHGGAAATERRYISRAFDLGRGVVGARGFGDDASGVFQLGSRRHGG